MSKLIALGTIGDLQRLPDANPPGTSRLEIVTADASKLLRELRAAQGVREATIFGREIHALVDTGAIEVLKAAHPEWTIRVIEASLEDIFVTLTYHIMAETPDAKSVKVAR